MTLDIIVYVYEKCYFKYKFWCRWNFLNDIYQSGYSFYQ